MHVSNHDIKGPSEAVWPLVGLVPPTLLIEMPYGALLPAGMDGILVAGKAISATHDGLAAAIGPSSRRLDVAALQRRLGELPRPDAGRSMDAEELVEAVARNAPLSRYNDLDYRESHGIPFVEAVLRADTTESLRAAAGRRTGESRTVLAQALALRGDPLGIDIIVEKLNHVLDTGQLPRQSSAVRNAQLAPDHAAVPEAAHLLYTLAFARMHESVPVWERVVGLVKPSYDAMWDSEAGIFGYVGAIRAGAARLAAPAAVPLLRHLHAAGCLHGQHRAEFEPDIVRAASSSFCASVLSLVSTMWRPASRSAFSMPTARLA